MKVRLVEVPLFKLAGFTHLVIRYTTKIEPIGFFVSFDQKKIMIQLSLDIRTIVWKMKTLSIYRNRTFEWTRRHKRVRISWLSCIVQRRCDNKILN